MPTSRPGASIIVLTDPGTRPPDRWSDAKIVHTPLDFVIALDAEIELVVLLGGFASEPAFGGFVRESYPELHVVEGIGAAQSTRTHEADALAPLEARCALSG